MATPEHLDLAFASLVSASFLEWEGLHKDVPSVLYHYTSADGLLGILGTKSLWLTDLRYVNDLAELQYGHELLSDQIRKRRAESQLTKIQVTFIENLLSRNSTIRPRNESVQHFSASFCTDGNQLSQWRAYRGTGGGYAIGFDLLHTIRLLSRQCRLIRVIYDASTQAMLIEKILSSVLEALHQASTTRGPLDDESERKLIAEAVFAFRLVTSEFLVAFKHPGFVEEKEWRLVYSTGDSPTFQRGCESPKFRAFQGNLIPYHDVRFDEVISASRDDTLGVPFPIAEVFVGPTVNAELNEASARAVLLSLNPDIVPNVVHSAIPLRWL